MKHLILSIISFCAVGATFAQTRKPAATAAVSKTILKTGVDSFSYAAGCNIATSMKEQGITNLNSSLMQKAMDDVFKGRTTALTNEQANMTLQQQLQAFASQKLETEKAAGARFVENNKKRAGVKTLPNGLQYEIIKAGAEGLKPTAEDTVVVNYIGKLTNGKEFDNSFTRGQPATFPLGNVIRGWTEILQLMTKGAEWKVYIPSELGYGDRGAGAGIPPGATLVFNITLLDIKPAVKQ